MYKNKKVEIKNDNGYVVVTDGKKEYFRAVKTEQNISIANTIYFAEKYEDRESK